MNLAETLFRLPPDKRQKVSSDIVTAVIIYYMNPTEYLNYIRKKVQESLGAKRKIFEFLSRLEPSAVDRFSYILTE